MKSLWSAAHRKNIIRRLDSLSPDAERRWGTMTAHVAIVHLADSIRMALGEIKEGPIQIPLRRQPLKWLAINVLPMPKGVKGPAGYFTTAPTGFEYDRSELERPIDVCANRPEDAPWGDNPFFGNLTKAQWGSLAYKHMDYHLRQFGC